MLLRAMKLKDIIIDLSLVYDYPVVYYSFYFDRKHEEMFEHFGGTLGERTCSTTYNSFPDTMKMQFKSRISLSFPDLEVRFDEFLTEFPEYLL